jgi:hypothetical protein
MAFGGLEDRFNSKMEELYRGTNRNSGVRAPSDEPYLEIKPSDKGRSNPTSDSRSLPIQSTIRDVKRMTNFMKSSDGLRFLGKQSLLATGNSFSETRIINPLFVVANAVPFLHIGRNLSNPSDFSVSGDINTRSPASTVEIGRAGRLQKNTGKAALAKVVGSSGKMGLLNLLPPNKLISAITNVFSVATGGSTSQDARPELDVNGTFYSIAIWQGFKKQQSPANALKSAKADLRTGNVSGAIKNITKAAKDFIKGIRPTGLTQLKAPEGRNNPNDYDMAGKRYFITDKKDGADRYLRDSVSFDDQRRPDATLAYLDRKVKAIRGQSPKIPGGVNKRDNSDTENKTTADQKEKSTKDSPAEKKPKEGFFSTTKKNIEKTAARAKKDIQAEANRAAKRVDSALRKALPDSTVDDIKKKIPLPQITPPSGKGSESPNPAEDKMLFPELSLRRQYLDSDRVKDIKDLLDAQKKNSFAYWKDNTVNRGWGGGNALKPGVDAFIDSNVRNSAPSYLVDYSNLQSVFKDNNGNSISDDTIKLIREKMGSDLINVFFYDFVNRNTIPFRAFISNINETVMPEVSDTRYIGRIDRNVVYVGVSREVSFQLRVQAFSSEELAVIWRKINYITGLCYPSRYDQFGFMIPPFVKLTIGDLWRDQPGYIKSLSHAIEDGTSWEITENSQAPHGIVMNITFAILEKNQMDSGGMFYPVGISRSTARNAPSVGQLPDQQKTALGTTETRAPRTAAVTENAKSVNGAGAGGAGASKPAKSSITNRVRKAFGFGNGGGFGNVG